MGELWQLANFTCLFPRSEQRAPRPPEFCLVLFFSSGNSGEGKWSRSAEMGQKMWIKDKEYNIERWEVNFYSKIYYFFIKWISCDLIQTLIIFEPTIVTQHITDQCCYVYNRLLSAKLSLGGLCINDSQIPHPPGLSAENLIHAFIATGSKLD